MYFGYFIGFCFTFFLVGSAQGAPFSDESLQREEHISFSSYIEKISREYLGKPYVLSPLGEGRPPDEDPRFREDAFDCTTFVETVIARTLCEDKRKIVSTLDAVRYQNDKVSFNYRRHLMTSQWIPDLIKEGILKDITSKVAKRRTKRVHLKLTPKRWKRRRIARSLKLPSHRIPEGRFSLPYIDVDDLLKFKDKIPPGTILNVVRENVPYTADLISHQGLVLQSPKMGLVLRHASVVRKRVVDVPLGIVLYRYQNPSKPRKWKVIGINLLSIVDAEGC